MTNSLKNEFFHLFFVSSPSYCHIFSNCYIHIENQQTHIRMHSVAHTVYTESSTHNAVSVASVDWLVLFFSRFSLRFTSIWINTKCFSSICCCFKNASPTLSSIEWVALLVDLFIYCVHWTLFLNKTKANIFSYLMIFFWFYLVLVTWARNMHNMYTKC